MIGSIASGFGSPPPSEVTEGFQAALRQAAFWAAHIAYWAAAFAANLLLVVVFDVADPVGFIALEIVLCLLATAALRSLSRRNSLLRAAGVSQVGLVCGGLVLSAVLIALALYAARSAFGLPPASRGEIVARLVITLSMLAIWCGFFLGALLLRDQSAVENRALRAEMAALRNEISMLHAQITPHFLFNSLNTVLACRHDPAAIETVT